MHDDELSMQTIDPKEKYKEEKNKDPKQLHTVNSGSEMIKALYISKFWIYCVNMLDRHVDT